MRGSEARYGCEHVKARKTIVSVFLDIRGRVKTSNRCEQPMENTTLRRTRNRVEKKQEKGCGSRTSHTRLTADGSADRIRVFRHCQKTTTVGHKNIVWADLWVCNENFAVFSSFFRGSERGSAGKLRTARSFFGNFFTRKR